MKKLKKFNTRQRAIFSVIIIGIVVFFITSPLSKIVYEILLPPNPVNNVTIIQKARELDLSWSRADEHDVIGYYITLDGEEINDEKLNNKSVDNYEIYSLIEGKEYTVQVGSKDASGNISNLAQTNVTTKSQNATIVLNPVNEATITYGNIAILAIFIGALVFFFTNWVLFYKVKGKRFFTIALYPTVVLIPLLVLSSSIILTINTTSYKFIFALGASLGVVFVSYLLMLTANILNGATILGQLPLEQAAKASQFIFGLVSTYIMLIFTFSSNFNLILKLGLVLAFVFYFTYSALSSIKELSEYHLLLRALSVVLVMFIAILAISVWPIESIYSILVLAIIYYIIFNVALEVRGKVGRSLWVEYGLLIGLITLLLVTNSVWGINGSII
ncbi:fibronectin type III domain-containing protein [Candidatus Dojkabacteria bacterium]|nr:fibronectin type III domain-containing protein [Candidatus Dojkabacteria bacterium]